jgi:flavodoxin
VFYFSGTGNFLKAAKTLAKELGNTAIVSMAKSGKCNLTEQYEILIFSIQPIFQNCLKRFMNLFLM